MMKDLLPISRAKSSKEQAYDVLKESILNCRLEKKFHLYLASKMRNRQIEAIFLNLQDQIHLMVIKTIMYLSQMLQVIDEHQRIFSALEEKNAWKAYKELILHLGNNEKILISNKAKGAYSSR